MHKVLLIIFLFLAHSAFTQNDQLAKNYFKQGEFEKALSIYEQLSSQSPNRPDYLLGVIQSYQQLENFDKAESLLKAKIKNTRNLEQLYVDLGYNYSLQGKTEEAKKNYELAIKAVDENPNMAYRIGSTFQKYSLLDEAARVYESAMALEGKMDFNVYLANIYGEQGKLDKMFGSYFNIIERDNNYITTAQRYFSLYITEDSNNEANAIFRKLLLKRLQENPAILYNQLLSWLFIQQKEFKKAFVQEKAIFQRSEELKGITDLAYIAISDNDYESAREIVNFIIENSYTPPTRLLANQILMTINIKTAKPKEYPAIEKQFEKLLEEFGRGKETYLLQIDYNHFLAFQNNKKEVAISNLKNLAKESLSDFQEARIKMELADILVMDEKFNEALIYYTQIQRKLQNNILAHEARFKVAQTSYFKGDFEWAQVQLDVLKKSTSQLIANDAMALSLMISDNSLEDSTQTALKKYARADLLAFQEKDQEAIVVLEDILISHKGEKIEDEALFKQARIYEKIGEYLKAEENYLKIIQFYNDDILADDAHYYLARLYETQLEQPEKAKKHYERILFDHADSIYFIEARKKFRTLRGDAIN